jgi:hypothetical protein
VQSLRTASLRVETRVREFLGMTQECEGLKCGIRDQRVFLSGWSVGYMVLEQENNCVRWSAMA